LSLQIQIDYKKPGFRMSSKVALRTRIVQVDRLHVEQQLRCQHPDWTFQNNPRQLGGSTGMG